MNHQSVNPYNGKTLKMFEAHSDAQLERAIETASACFEKWRHTSRFKSDDEAVALANDSDFGLGGSIFTKDIERGKRLASRIDTGMMFINQPTWTTPELPFGGVKNSGYGRELSSLGIQKFVNKVGSLRADRFGNLGVGDRVTDRDDMETN